MNTCANVKSQNSTIKCLILFSAGARCLCTSNTVHEQVKSNRACLQHFQFCCFELSLRVLYIFDYIYLYGYVICYRLTRYSDSTSKKPFCNTVLSTTTCLIILHSNYCGYLCRYLLPDYCFLISSKFLLKVT